MKDSGALEFATAELQATGPCGSTTGAAIAAAGEIGGEEAIEALTGYLNSQNASSSASRRPSPCTENCTRNPPQAPSNRWSGIPTRPSVPPPSRAWAGCKARSLRARLEAGLKDPVIEVRRAIVARPRAISKSTNAVPALLTAYADQTLRADAFAAFARKRDERAIDAAAGRHFLQRRGATQRRAPGHPRAQRKVLRVSKRGPAPSHPRRLLNCARSTPGTRKRKKVPLFARQIEQHTLEEYLDAAVKISGDAAAGTKALRRTGTA